MQVFVVVHDIERLGKCEEMRIPILRGDPAHTAQVVSAENVASNMPAEETRLGFGYAGCDLREIQIRMTLGNAPVPAPCLPCGRISE